jgi:hypothetical protein
MVAYVKVFARTSERRDVDVYGRNAPARARDRWPRAALAHERDERKRRDVLCPDLLGLTGISCLSCLANEPRGCPTFAPRCPMSRFSARDGPLVAAFELRRTNGRWEDVTAGGTGHERNERTHLKRSSAARSRGVVALNARALRCVDVRGERNGRFVTCARRLAAIQKRAGH